MTARVLAVALACVLVAAPASMTMCEAACGERFADVMPAGRGERHSCHEAAASDQVQVAGIPHGCSHTNGDDQIGAEQPAKVIPSQVAVVTDATLAPVVSSGSSGIAPRDVTHSPPGPLVLPTQLRI
jgi:hypothetical protein